MTYDICSKCGKPESEHHAFVPIPRPKGCECNPKDWRDKNNIPAVCEKYVGDSDGLCEKCEHLKECHVA